MKIDIMNKTTLLLLFLIPFGINYMAQAESKWTADNTHSNFGFKAKHNGISYAVGEFRSFDLKISTNGDEFMNSEIESKKDKDEALKKDFKIGQYVYITLYVFLVICLVVYAT